MYELESKVENLDKKGYKNNMNSEIMGVIIKAGISISPATRAAIEEAVYSLTQATTDNISKI
jgi:hypothetical protein